MPKIKIFVEYEKRCADNGYNCTQDYKLGVLFKELKRIIESTATYKKFNSENFDNCKFAAKRNCISKNLGILLVSFDLKEANYSVLKSFNVNSEFPNTWNEFLSKLYVPEALKQSKSFRQFIMGNLNPTRNQKVQTIKIREVIDQLIRLGVDDNQIVFISSDEIVVCLSENDIKNKLWVHLSEINNKIHPFELRAKIFKLDEIAPNVLIKTYYSSPVFTDTILETHKELYGVSGNQFYLNFKKFILNEAIDDRDIMFILENKIAKWVI